MGFVLVVRTLEKDDVGIALVRQNVRGDLVQEPTIVRNTNGGAVPGLNGVLEASKGGDIEVVGRLVEKQTVAAARESSGELQSVAFTTGEAADLLLLIGALKVVPAAVRARVHLGEYRE